MWRLTIRWQPAWWMPWSRRESGQFGPRKNAAVIESSKVFSKKSDAKKYGIPTAGYEVFSEPKKAMDYITAQNKFPVVVKADGLALGKGSDDLPGSGRGERGGPLYYGMTKFLELLATRS